MNALLFDYFRQLLNVCMSRGLVMLKGLWCCRAITFGFGGQGRTKNNKAALLVCTIEKQCGGGYEYWNQHLTWNLSEIPKRYRFSSYMLFSFSFVGIICIYWYDVLRANTDYLLSRRPITYLELMYICNKKRQVFVSKYRITSDALCLSTIYSRAVHKYDFEVSAI